MSQQRETGSAGEQAAQRLVRLPRAPSVLVGKPSITNLLDRHAPLTVVCAPRGFGKTALVSSWARSRRSGPDLVWVSCRLPSVMADGMPAPLWGRLADEMWRAGASPLAPSLIPGRRDVVAALAARDEPLCVVIDDFDDNPDPCVAGELLDLVQRFETLDVVVIARSSQTADALLASTVDSVVLGPQDLLLSVVDTTRLVAALGLDLSADAVAALVQDTGGWAALLRAVLVGSGPHSRPGSRGRPGGRRTSGAHEGVAAEARPAVVLDTGLPRGVLDLADGFSFLRSVWGELDDPGMQRFVQRTGLLGCFTVDDARRSSGVRDCVRYVNVLVDVGLLRRQDQDGEPRFRYVEAVRLAATEIFRAEDPRRYRRARRRLARLRSEQGRVDEAMVHLLEARMWDACAELVDRHWALLVAGSPEVVADVVERVPTAVLERHPRLAIARTHLLPVLRPRRLPASGDDHDSKGRLAREGEKPTEVAGTVSASGSMEEGLAQIVTLRLTGDYSTATRIAERAEVGLAPIFDGVDVEAKGELAPLLYEWAVTRFLGADVEGALDAFRQSAELAHGAGRPLVRREAAVGASLCCALLGFLAQAEEWLQEVPESGAADRWDGTEQAQVSDGADVTGGDGAQTSAGPPGRTARGATHGVEGRGVRLVRSILGMERLERPEPGAPVDDGDLGVSSGLGVVEIVVRAQAALQDGTHYQALAEVEAARETLDLSSGSRNLREALLASAAVDLYLGLGYVSRARSAVEASGSHYGTVGLALARTDLVAGDLDSAVEQCRVWLGTHLNGPRLRLDLLLVLVASEIGRGHRHEAAVALEEATVLFRATGLMRSFLKVPRSVLEDLAPQVPGVRAVLDAPGFAESVPLFPSESPRARLSSREMQVLGSLAESQSLASVAKSLFLSSNTVKTHLRSIYQKLGTHSSVETVEKARDLGLLDGLVAGQDTGRRGTSTGERVDRGSRAEVGRVAGGADEVREDEEAPPT